MSIIDWVILTISLGLILIYGTWIGRRQSGSNSYMLANRDKQWFTVLIGIMATQASAITFISGPGQSYTDGMRFLQYYLGLPLAMIVISTVFIPIFQRLKVATAYEYLDVRFDRKTRILSGFLFLFSRGVSTGMSIYAPAIVVSAIFSWNIYLSILVIGGLLMTYTLVGGAQSIAATQKIQFSIIIISMLIASVILVQRMPEGVGFSDSLRLAAYSGKLNIITTDFEWKDKYNVWSGIIGGFFLSLSYFGTDQSQVGRYLSAKDVKQARLGILMNGFVKIPMQFGILLIGALLYVFFIFESKPLSFNDASINEMRRYNQSFTDSVIAYHNNLQERQKETAFLLLKNKNAENVAQFQNINKQVAQERKSISNYISEQNLPIPKDDTNFVFLYFVKKYLPQGLVGLVIAIIFLASWGSISAALNSLASSSLIDMHQLMRSQPMTEKQELFYGRLHTLVWGIFSIAVAFFATQMGSLIEAVNVLGSLFYGPMLGIFLVAFFLKKVKGTSVFYSALFAELCVFFIYYLDAVGFLWLNVIGSMIVVLMSFILNFLSNKKLVSEV